MSSTIDRYREALQACQAQGTYRTIPHLQPDGKYVTVGGQRLLNLNSNDYLGLLEERQLWQTFVDTQAAALHPSSASSRLLTGNSRSADHFETDLQQAYHTESALLWDSGYHANSGILPVLSLPGTLIVADKLVHASIIDGIRLSGAPFLRFRHNDLTHLQSILSKYANDYQTVWVVTESLFSMDGDFAPLQEIVALKESYPHLYIYVDEAHAVGVYGDEGLGIAAEKGLTDRVDLLIGTLGKALGSVGAYSLQSDTLRQLLVSRARSLIFTTALPEITVAWSRYLFNQVREMRERREYLGQLLRLFTQESGIAATSQIIPIVIPGEKEVTKAAELFGAAGYYIRPIRKPTVPAGSERLRISLTSAMTTTEVTDIARLCRQI
ncbi:MAG: 8-amino-7-oxononanoate synthase [Porphyromonas sp.]|nr:8-amino-7-oxononanoate synthase [Porphyromonas sp.]